MGLFDIPAPLYSAIDSLLAALPPLARLSIWAVLTGILSMVLYWLCSAQDKVETAKQRALAARKTMAAYDGTEFDEMWPLARESLAASSKHFLIVLGPAVLSSLPALTLIVWVSNHFSYTLPTAGDSIQVSAIPEESLPEVGLTAAGNQSLIWPGADSPLDVAAADGTPLFSLPLQAAVPVIHQRLWWNTLIGNPNGYLPPESPAQEILFDLERVKYLSFGPDWIRTWEAPYFLLLILCSLGIKVAFKIH